ncbi:MAG: hypothetical protein ABJN26_28590 [Stappiaceae bacterium]
MLKVATSQPVLALRRHSYWQENRSQGYSHSYLFEGGGNRRLLLIDVSEQAGQKTICARKWDGEIIWIMRPNRRFSPTIWHMCDPVGKPIGKIHAQLPSNCFWLATDAAGVEELKICSTTGHRDYLDPYHVPSPPDALVLARQDFRLGLLESTSERTRKPTLLQRLFGRQFAGDQWQVRLDCEERSVNQHLLAATLLLLNDVTFASP